LEAALLWGHGVYSGWDSSPVPETRVS